ncbi:hypothetical protein RHGRI_031461 [Rhododendron griersonianum]|uniref:Uncharacterized protein n=1 Tax=Rhododendron griersonianum TaxID=479676 RepID=A0AAV6ICN4_9ERIC|nr:hypothetical protein RHGRI_031461 [Rhododendron griersonianum]
MVIGSCSYEVWQGDLRVGVRYMVTRLISYAKRYVGQWAVVRLVRCYFSVDIVHVIMSHTLLESKPLDSSLQRREEHMAIGSCSYEVWQGNLRARLISYAKRHVGQWVVVRCYFSVDIVHVIMSHTLLESKPLDSSLQVGVYDTLELRDGGSHYLGKGVSKAVDDVNSIIGPALIGKGTNYPKSHYPLEGILLRGEVQLMVDRRKYIVTMEEEESFRTVISTIRVPDYVVNSEPDKEDDEVDNEDDDKDASKEKEDKLVDDMEKHRVKNSDDRAKNNKEEAEKMKEHGFNGRHQSGLENEPAHEKQAVQGDMPIGIPITVESSTEESSNSAHGLVSFVQDSQSPINEECLDYANSRGQDQNAEIRLGDKHEQGEDSENAANFQMQCDSNISIRASQVHGINLHMKFSHLSNSHFWGWLRVFGRYDGTDRNLVQLWGFS